jgi:phosphoribosylamine---glycine ligase
MKILIVGNGGREHALLRKLREDAPDADFHITLGNGGTSGHANALPIGPTEVQTLADWAAAEGVDLTVVGPEVPLAEGIVDRFSARGLPIFGPTRAAAEIESSKAFAKDLMRRHGIPTAAFEVFRDLEPARDFIRHLGGPLVVKASGLAAGKGAVVCESTEQALTAAGEMLSGDAFGSAGDQVVVEEFMDGEELSVFAVCDGDRFVTLLPAQDHKRIGEGDVGPNTGGMGAYAPVSIATPEIVGRIEAEIIGPTVAALAAAGRPYRGVLYAGVMLTADGPKVVEFNCRFGDPETQVLVPLMRSSLLDLLAASADGTLRDVDPPRWHEAAAVTTVVASGGYPGAYRTGISIDLPADLEKSGEVLVLHAGTAVRDGRLVTAGGRVLSVTGFGPDVTAAALRSRDAANRIEFEGRTFRRDIGWREIERLGAAVAGSTFGSP